MTNQYRQNMICGVKRALAEWGSAQNSPLFFPFTAEREQDWTAGEWFALWKQEGQAALARGQWEPLEYLFARFQTGEPLRIAVALSLAAELDSACGAAIRSLQGGESRPSAGLAAQLSGLETGWEEAFWQADPHFFQPPGAEASRWPWWERPLKLQDRVVEFALGQWENLRLARWTRRLEEGSQELASAGAQAYQSWSRGFLRGADRELAGWLFLLGGPEGAGKKTQLIRLARESGRPVLCADRRRFPENSQGQAWWELLWECRVKQMDLAVEHWNPSDGREEEWNRFPELARQTGRPLILLSEEMDQVQIPGFHLWKTELPLPDLGESAELWNQFAGGYTWKEPFRAEEMAGLFRLSPGQMEETLAGAWARNGEELNTEMVKAFCRESLSVPGTGRMRKPPLKFGWEDLILPDPVIRLLQDACAQVKNRYAVYERWGFSGKIAGGSGTSLVFSGSPGTGKTMAAQVFARELGLELVQVDLASVVSKYIGETEKNLDAIFAEGQKSQAVLFFDEADVLFSKRTEIRDSHDKYSNMEAAFLLQKMEEYSGTVILATNYLQNIDEAFKRRITFLVEFPFPDPANRKRLWEISIPAPMTLAEDVDLAFLASHFELSGSQIKNSVRNGAFLAVRDGAAAVGMGHFLMAIRRELEKSGKKLSAVDFGGYGLPEDTTL